MKLKTRHYWYVGGVIGLVAINVLFWTLLSLQKAYAHKIPLGVAVAGQSAAGLTEAEAIAKFKPKAESFERQPILLLLEDQPYQTTLGELGYRIDTEAMVKQAIAVGQSKSLFSPFMTITRFVKTTAIPLHYSVDANAYATAFEKLTATYERKAKDIALEYKDNTLTVIAPENGLTLSKEATNTQIRTVLAQNPQSIPSRITLLPETAHPGVETEAQIANAKQFLTKLLAQPLQITIDDYKTEIAPNDMYSYVVYAVKDNELIVTFDETKVRDKAQEIAKKVAITPVAKKVYSVDNSILAEGRDGRKLNTTETANQILNRLKNATVDTPLALAAEKIDRSIVTETPEYTLGLDSGKYIDIDLSLQRLNLIEGTAHIGGYNVSTGKWSTPTPIGSFKIQNHIQTAWSKRYKLFMPFWMAIQKETGEYDGYGIHGLPYWPNGYVEGESHIGRPASHGCIRVSSEAIEYVYNWASDGTKVFIHE